MGTLPGELKQNLLNNKRAQAQVVVRRGQKIVVIGAMPTNLPAELRDHPFIEVWQGDNGLKRHTLTDSVGMVFHTRFVSHVDLERFREQAHRKGIDFYPQPFTTGDLREILGPLAPTPRPVVEPASLLAPPPGVEPVADAVPAGPEAIIAAAPPAPLEEVGGGVIKKRHQTKRGAMKRFVAERANFSAPNDTAEANRLWPYAQNDPELKGSTRSAIMAAFRAGRKALGLPPRRQFRGRKASARTRAVPPPPTVRVASPKLTAAHGSHADVLKLFDEAAAHMQNGVAAVQLAKERYLQLVESHKAADDVKARLKAMLDTM